MENPGRPLVIYVEDDEEDQELCRFALEEAEIDIEMRFIGDGQSAIDYFNRLTADEVRGAWPRLVLLDLSMPAVSGWDLLRHIRSIPAFCHIPVVIFTTSNAPRDMLQAYEDGANAYMVKPAGLEPLSQCFRTTMQYWLKTVTTFE